MPLNFDKAHETVCGLIMNEECDEEQFGSYSSYISKCVAASIDLAGMTMERIRRYHKGVEIAPQVITSLYVMPVIVFEISDRTPHTMFQLGLRLALGRPSIALQRAAGLSTVSNGAFKLLEYPHDTRDSNAALFTERLTIEIKASSELSLKHSRKISSANDNWDDLDHVVEQSIDQLISGHDQPVRPVSQPAMSLIIAGADAEILRLSQDE